jgi:hypothetical protein
MKQQARRRAVQALAVLAAVVGLVIGMMPTPAQASDDWTAVSGPGTTNCRSASSAYGDSAYAYFDICWSGTKVWVRAYAEDTWDGDGYCAIARIKYLADTNGNGVYESHTRSTETDCNPPFGDWSSWYRSNYPTKSLVGAACITTDWCDDWR